MNIFSTRKRENEWQWEKHSPMRNWWHHQNIGGPYSIIQLEFQIYIYTRKKMVSSFLLLWFATTCTHKKSIVLINKIGANEQSENLNPIGPWGLRLPEMDITPCESGRSGWSCTRTFYSLSLPFSLPLVSIASEWNEWIDEWGKSLTYTMGKHWKNRFAQIGR